MHTYCKKMKIKWNKNGKINTKIRKIKPIMAQFLKIKFVIALKLDFSEGQFNK